MSLPHCHLFSFSNELLIEIISNLFPVDIYACQCTCRRLNSVIINSHLLQYIKRTALNGVFDSLEPGLSLPDRLDVLKGWETAWMEMDLREPNAIIDLPVCAEGLGTRMISDIFLSGQYIIMASPIGAAFYSFLDMHASSSHTNAARWTTIKVSSPILAFAFASELNLIVTISTPPLYHHHHPKTTVTIRPLEFSTGEPHPLARQPKLKVSVSGSAAHNLSDTMVIGDFILYWVGASHGNVSGLCGIYLVAWKEGWVSELRASPPGLYSSPLSVLSEEIILLVRKSEPALELCRLSNIDDREKASLEIVRVLSLPVTALTAGISSWRVLCFAEHPGHVLFSKNQQQHTSLHQHRLLSSSSGLSTQQPEGRIDTRRHLHSVPVDGIVVLQMRLYNNYYVFDLTVRRRTLLEFSDSQAQAGAAGTGAGTGAGTAVVVGWEKWGPNKAHILEHPEHDSPLCHGSLIGERCATVLLRHIMIRDYNSFRVQRALELFGGAEKEVMLECGSVVKVVKEKLVYHGGEVFCDNIETSLPYVKTVVPYNWCNEILMDKDNLVVVRRDPGQLDEMKFYLHSL